MVHKRKMKTKCKRHSKTCTYHMNETYPKTYRYLLKKDGMPSGASPSLDAWVSLNIYLGCLGHPQAWALASLPSSHIETFSIIEHFIHTKPQHKCLYNPQPPTSLTLISPPIYRKTIARNQTYHIQRSTSLCRILWLTMWCHPGHPQA